MTTTELVSTVVNSPIPAIPSEEMAKDIANLDPVVNQEEIAGEVGKEVIEDDIDLTQYDYNVADDDGKAAFVEETGLSHEELSEMSAQDIYDYINGYNQETDLSQGPSTIEELEANLSPEERAELDAENLAENLAVMRGETNQETSEATAGEPKVLPDLTKPAGTLMPVPNYDRPDFAYDLEDAQAKKENLTLGLLIRNINFKFVVKDEEIKGPLYSELVKVLVTLLAERARDNKPIHIGPIDGQIDKLMDVYKETVINKGSPASPNHGWEERRDWFKAGTTVSQYLKKASQIALMAYTGKHGITMAMFKTRGKSVTAFSKVDENGNKMFYHEYQKAAREKGYIHERMAVPANVAFPIMKLDAKVAEQTGQEIYQPNHSTNLVELTWKIMGDLVNLEYRGYVRNPETGEVKAPNRKPDPEKATSQGANDKAKESLKEQSLGMLSNVKASLDKNEIKAEQVVTVFDFVNQALKDKTLILGLIKADKDFASMLRDIQSELDAYDENIDAAAA